MTADFYDDADLVDAYLSHRNAPVRSPNLVMEEPALLAEVGDLSGRRVLDLGCGDGGFSRLARTAGAESYTGVDRSTLMVARAGLAQADTGAAFHQVDLAEPGALTAALSGERVQSVSAGERGRFDLITCRTVLHYLADVGPILREVTSLLAPEGRFVASVVHPVITCRDQPDDGPRLDWTVDDYFLPGPRRRRWFGSNVVWYHRTVEEWVAAIVEAGMTVDGLREAPPVRERFEDDESEFSRRRRVPLFLVLGAGRRTGP